MHTFIFLKNISKKVIAAVLGFLAFSLDQKYSGVFLHRTPKYFRTKKCKFLERRSVKGKRKSVLQSKFLHSKTQELKIRSQCLII